MSLLILTFVNLLAQQVQAQVNSLPAYRLRNNRQSIDDYLSKSGVNYANRICSAYTTSDLQNDCQNIVKNAEFLDVNAVALCESKFYISNKTLNCLTSISSKIYESSELQKCGNSTNEYDIYQCLSQSGQLVKSENVSTEIQQNTAYQNTKSICDSFTSSATKQDCQNILDESYFMDLSAINLCQNKLSVSPKMLQCLQSINNKIYSPTEINQCSQESQEDNVLICLSSTGDSMDSVTENQSDSESEIIDIQPQ